MIYKVHTNHFYFFNKRNNHLTAFRLSLSSSRVFKNTIKPILSFSLNQIWFYGLCRPFPTTSNHCFSFLKICKFFDLLNLHNALRQIKTWKLLKMMLLALKSHISSFTAVSRFLPNFKILIFFKILTFSRKFYRIPTVSMMTSISYCRLMHNYWGYISHETPLI